MMNYFQNLLGNYQFNVSHLAILAGVLVVLYFLWSYFRGPSEEEMMMAHGGPFYGPDGMMSGEMEGGAGEHHALLPPMPQPQNGAGAGAAEYPQDDVGQMGGQAESGAYQAQGGGFSNRMLVLYYAPWCTYCKELMPTWDALSQKYGDRMRKIDCDQYPDESEKQNIEVFPTIILFVDGKPTEVLKGIKDGATIEKMLA